MKKQEMKVEIINHQCATIFAAKEHCFIGVSPFNSYFIETNMVSLFNWANNHFKKISIFLPDEISVHTLHAIGYDRQRAAYKTRRQDAYLKNKVIRALNQLNMTESQIQQIVITLSDLKKNPSYIECYKDCLNEFENNISFREGCLLTSEWILSNYISVNNITEDAKSEATKYFLAELPLFLNTPAILNIKSSSFIYHSIPEYLKQLFIENKCVASNQGFIVAKIETTIETGELV